MCGLFICATFLLHFRYNNTAEAISHSYLIHNVWSLYESLHSHCTCPYIHCTHTVRVLIFTALTLYVSLYSLHPQNVQSVFVR
jgi:hypothetical protein